MKALAVVVEASSCGIIMTIAARNQKGSMIRTRINVLVPMEWTMRAMKPTKKPRATPL